MLVDRVVEADEFGIPQRLPVHGQRRDGGEPRRERQADERRAIAEVNRFEQEVQARVDGKRRVGTEGHRQRGQHQRTAPAPAPACRVAACQREPRTENADHRVRITARGDGVEVAGPEEAREGRGQDARLGFLCAEIPPDEDRHGHEQHRVQQVVAQGVAEDRHRQECEQPEVLRDVRGRGIAAQEPPVPPDDNAAAEQGNTVDGHLEQFRPVILEGNLGPHGERKAMKQRGEQKRAPCGQEGKGRGTPYPRRAADLTARDDDQQRGRGQGQAVPRLPPSMQRSRLRGPS